MQFRDSPPTRTGGHSTLGSQMTTRRRTALHPSSHVSITSAQGRGPSNTAEKQLFCISVHAFIYQSKYVQFHWCPNISILPPADDYNRVLLKLDEGHSRESDHDEDEEDDSSDEEDEESTKYINASHIDVRFFTDTSSVFTEHKTDVNPDARTETTLARLIDDKLPSCYCCSRCSLINSERIPSFRAATWILKTSLIKFITSYLLGLCTTIEGFVFLPTQGYWGPHTFITAQTPLPDTMADFWCMVYQKKASTIVMLSDCSEGDKVP